MIKISLTSLLIVNDPVITALPENGNVFPLPPFIAYDAVNEKLDVISYSDPVRNWPGLSCLDIISISHL
jgi:hypothetical protein